MNRLCPRVILILALVFGPISMVRAQPTGNLRVYFGTYSSEHSQGIYLSTLDVKTGKLAPAELAGEERNPSFLAIHPTQRFLYSVSEISDFEGKNVGGVSAFSIDSKSGRLTRLNQQSSGGEGPCHLVVDASGKNVLVANYGGGSVAVLPINDDGKLSPPSSTIKHEGSSVDKKRQGAPYAHSINLDVSNQFAYAADLGLDKVLIYRFDAKQHRLVANDPAAGVVAAGSGPRHSALHPSGTDLFVNNELSSTVTSFARDAVSGALKEIQTLSTLPQATPGNSTAETVVHPNGRFVYVSNRGHDSLAIFKIDEANGRLTALGHHSTGGKTPRNFNIDPSGTFVLAANQDSNTVVVLKIHPETGALSDTGNAIDVGRPVCVKFVPLSK